MENNKYVFTNNETVIDGVTYVQIKAVRDFDVQNELGKRYTVRSGELGGWIESGYLSVLNQSGSCWVHPNVYVRCNSKIGDSAVVMGASENARVFISSSKISGNTTVVNSNERGDIYIMWSTITGDSIITAHGNEKMVVVDSRIHSSDVNSCDVNYSMIKDSEVSRSKVGDADTLYPTRIEDALIRGADIRDTKEYTAIQNLGRSNRTLYCYPDDKRRPTISTGCFRGTFNQFENEVNFTYDLEDWDDSCGYTQEEFAQLKEEYLAALSFLRTKYKRILE